MTRAETMLEKLQKYEENAENGNCAIDYYSTVGEGFTLYVKDCVENKKTINIMGWMRHVSKIAKDLKVD